MKYKIIELRNSKHKPFYILHEIITENLTQPVYPVVRYRTKEEAEKAIKEV